MVIRLKYVEEKNMKYFIRNFETEARFTSRDLCRIVELINPANDILPFDSFSISHATISPHSNSIPHKLVKSTEIYIVLEGEATLYLNQERVELKKGTTVIIPASTEQHVVNNSDKTLEFLCIVTPPWRADDEIIL